MTAPVYNSDLFTTYKENGQVTFIAEESDLRCYGGSWRCHYQV